MTLRTVGLLLLVTAIASCRGPRIGSGVPPTTEADHDRAKPHLEKLGTRDSIRAMVELLKDERAALAAFPRVLALFRKSLEVRVPGQQFPSGNKPDQVRAAHIRAASIHYFRDLGLPAGAATADLLRLLEMRESRNEYGSGQYQIGSALRRVAAEHIELLAQAAKTLRESRARYELAWTLGRMPDSKAAVAPVLIDMIDDESLYVSRTAAVSLSRIDCVTREVIERMRARAGKIPPTGDRVGYEVLIERIAPEAPGR